jgi:hypothetical protein
VLRDQGKLAEAEPFYQQALEKNRQRYGGEHANTITAILRMASLNVAQGKHAEALALLTPHSRQGPVGDPGHHRGAPPRVAAGALRRGPHRAGEAAGRFHRGGSRLARGPRHLRQGLADLYAKWDKAVPGQGYDAKAAAWRAKLPRETAPRPRERK